MEVNEGYGGCPQTLPTCPSGAYTTYTRSITRHTATVHITVHGGDRTAATGSAGFAALVGNCIRKLS